MCGHGNGQGIPSVGIGWWRLVLWHKAWELSREDPRKGPQGAEN